MNLVILMFVVFLANVPLSAQDLNVFKSPEFGFSLDYPNFMHLDDSKTPYTKFKVVTEDRSVAYSISVHEANSLKGKTQKEVSDAMFADPSPIIEQSKPWFPDFQIVKKEIVQFCNLPAFMFVAAYSQESLGLKTNCKSLSILQHRENRVYTITFSSLATDFEKLEEVFVNLFSLIRLFEPVKEFTE
ncbi:MAG TPA: hypothetical protein PLM07_15785 [Candidatus Rifleibacterium sp.]|nr:hypothetical protein [Candidatus Rifleibacterium sp.]HPT47342.1 hypothetical protein [Candidatus Rifleibacterium sp.]